jgi:hypothetical protein
MAGTVLDVEPQDFVTSSSSAAAAARAVSSAGARLRGTLSGSSSMAGSDPTGRKWATQYDKVAADAVAGVDALETAFGQIAAGLSVTGLNYATAEWLSSGKSGHAPGYSVPSLPAAVCSAAPPSSSGGTGSCDIPGWHYVADFIGDMWPDGDTGKLRAAKSAWESFADQLDTVHGTDVTRILSALDGTTTPELPAIHETVSTVRSNVSRLSQEARNLASAAGQLAEQIDKVHRQTEQELISLGEQLAATAAVGIGLTIFTAGLSDAAGALAAGGEIAAAVARILSFIAELGTTVSRVVETIAESAGAVARVAGVSEQITIRIVTIAGNSVVTGVGGAVTNVGATQIVDPGSNLADAAVQGFVGGAAFGVLGEGAKAAFAARAARDTARSVSTEQAVVLFSDGAKADTLSESELAALRGQGHSAAIFGDDLKPYYEKTDPTLGAPGRPFFVMPSSEAAEIRNAADAARQTGMSPSTQKAYIAGKPVYAVVFPKDGIPHRVPVASDAMGWPHYLPGGHTAVRLEGPTGGYLVNTTHELVIPGGTPVPPGSVLVKIVDGDWQLLRRIK